LLLAHTNAIGKSVFGPHQTGLRIKSDCYRVEWGIANAGMIHEAREEARNINGRFFVHSRMINIKHALFIKR